MVVRVVQMTSETIYSIDVGLSCLSGVDIGSLLLMTVHS